MGIRKRDVHFSDWAKVRDGLIASNVTAITASSTDEEVRAFLTNTTSDQNPFYYYVVYIKSTKEIYTHGQFYNCSPTDWDDIIDKPELVLKSDHDADIVQLETTKQDQLVSGTNIKTINDVSLLGSGNINTLHSGNIGNYKLSQFTDDVVAGKYLPITGGIINTNNTTPLNIKNTQSNSTEVGIRFMCNNDSKAWVGYNTQNGINLYTYNGSHRLGVKDDGTAYLDSNTLIHSGNIKDQYVAGVYDSYNPLMKITFNYAGDAVTSNPTWLACWNGYTLSYVSPNDVKAGSATKLRNSCKLWGQSFDGTNNVSGDINNAAGGIYIHETNEINSFNGKLYLNHRGSGLTGYGSTNDIVMVANGGNVGIGTTSPTERLDVSGNIKASGNIQCSNLIPTGVINQLNNNSYIVHNAVSNGGHKMWITDGTGKSISAGNAFNLDAINIISDTSLLLGAHLDYNIKVLKANNRIAKVIDSDNYSTLLPYKTPVAISNTYSSDPHNVAMADNTLYIVNENESDGRGCTILSFPTNDGSTPLTCGLLYITYTDATGEFSCPTVIWSYNITPLMEPGATFEMWFTSYDGGTTWYGTHTVYK